MTKWVYFVNERTDASSGVSGSRSGSAGADGNDERLSSSSVPFLRNSSLLTEINATSGPVAFGYAFRAEGEDVAAEQDEALGKLPCDYVFEDHSVTASCRRSGLQALLTVLKPLDTMVVWRLDRLGLSLLALIELLADLRNRQVGFRAIDEAIVMPPGAVDGDLGLLGKLASFERLRISETTKAALQAAQARGRQAGRPRSLTDAQVREAEKAVLEDGESIADVAERLGVHKRTLYRAIGQSR